MKIKKIFLSLLVLLSMLLFYMSEVPVQAATTNTNGKEIGIFSKIITPYLLSEQVIDFSMQEVMYDPNTGITTTLPSTYYYKFLNYAHGYTLNGTEKRLYLLEEDEDGRVFMTYKTVYYYSTY